MPHLESRFLAASASPARLIIPRIFHGGHLDWDSTLDTYSAQWLGGKTGSSEVRMCVLFQLRKKTATLYE